MSKKSFIIAYIVLFVIVAVLFSLYINFAFAQIQSTVGNSVEISRNVWNHQKDSMAGDNLSTGIAASGVMGFDGAAYDRIRGDSTYGLDVDVTRMPTGGGTAFYAIKRDNIAAVSVNLAFGFTASMVVVEVPSTNTDNLVIDWIGGTAAAPAANTAGDDIMEPGRTIVFDNYHVASISVIAAGGTQTVYVRAYQ
jgi:hypothetical protein